MSTYCIRHNKYFRDAYNYQRHMTSRAHRLTSIPTTFVDDVADAEAYVSEYSKAAYAHLNHLDSTIDKTESNIAELKHTLERVKAVVNDGK